MYNFLNLKRNLYIFLEKEKYVISLHLMKNLTGKLNFNSGYSDYENHSFFNSIT